MGVIKIKHSYNSGDLISILPSLRQLHEDTGMKTILYQRLNLPAYYYDNALIVTKDNEGNSVCMNEDIFYRLKPLVEAQKYIHSFEIWKGEEIDYDCDLSRDSKLIPMPSGEIYSWGWTLFPELTTNLSKDWVKVDKMDIDFYNDKILVNRTNRYINPYITYFFLKEHEDKVIFSGTETEHGNFCKQWGLTLAKVTTKDFYELAQIIASCKFGIYNQSLHFHIAQSMHLPRILELCPQFPNTFNNGKDGYGFYHQKSFEYFFNKLINR